MLTISLLFLVYSLLSYVLLFRDLWTLEVIATKFYPQFFMSIDKWKEIIGQFKLNTVPTLAFVIIIAGLFWFYFKIIKKPVKGMIFWAIIFQLIVFFSYPILSTDVLNYILSDRIAVVYHRNVWTTKSNEFENDPYFYLVYPIYKDADWTNMTRIYGGINQSIYSPVTAMTNKLFGADLFANLATHKIVILLFVIATLVIIPSVLIFFNPLFVIETAGSGHNDIIMLFFTVLCLKLYNNNKFWLAGMFLGMATQVKNVMVLLFIFLVLKLISELKIKQLITFILLYLGTVLTVYHFMGINPMDTVVRTAGSINVYWQSFPMVVDRLIPFIKPLLMPGLIILLGIQGLRTLIYRLNPVEIFSQTLLIYLLFFLGAYWNWYPIWLLVLTPFISPDSKLKPFILALTVSSMLGYSAYWVSLRLNYQFFLWPAIIYLTVLSGPLFIWLRNLKKNYY